MKVADRVNATPGRSFSRLVVVKVPRDLFGGDH